MLTVTGVTQSFTMNGPITVTQTDAATSLNLSNVLYKTGDCYPSGGSMTVTKTKISEKITFSASTATTGKGVVTIGTRSVPASLPSYGKSPASGGRASGPSALAMF